MMVPRDMAKCAVRQAKYVFVTAPDSGIINDPVLLRLEAGSGSRSPTAMSAFGRRAWL